jgi:hypothetical protein
MDAEAAIRAIRYIEPNEKRKLQPIAQKTPRSIASGSVRTARSTLRNGEGLVGRLKVFRSRRDQSQKPVKYAVFDLISRSVWIIAT